MKLRTICFVCLSFCANLLVAQCIQNTNWIQTVPSEGLPKDLDLRKANNNLDLLWYNNRFYLAFRNAPTHFASKKVKLFIISSEDLETWRLETEVFMNTDMREPRLFEWNDTLFLYFFEAGHKMLRFQPKSMRYIYKAPGKTWTTETFECGLDGFVPWRIKQHKGKLYMSAYYGKDLYKGHGGQYNAALWLFTSTDGKHWKKLSEEPQLSHERSVSEAGFTFDEEGNLWGVARLELDGSYTFYAHKDSLHKWQYVYSEYKYDSPITFREGNDIFLIARRNMYKDGRFVQFKNKPKRNLLKYSLTRKKTAIFKLDKVNMKWIHLKDFASTGDTAFPGVTKLKSGNWLVVNYSSDIYGPEKTWIQGQLRKTNIYRSILKIGNCE